MNDKQCCQLIKAIKEECKGCKFEKIEIEQHFIFSRLVIDRYRHSSYKFLLRSNCKRVGDALASNIESQRLREQREL